MSGKQLASKQLLNCCCIGSIYLTHLWGISATCNCIDISKLSDWHLERMQYIVIFIQDSGLFNRKCFHSGCRLLYPCKLWLSQSFLHGLDNFPCSQSMVCPSLSRRYSLWVSRGRKLKSSVTHPDNYSTHLTLQLRLIWGMADCKGNSFKLFPSKLLSTKQSQKNPVVYKNNK